MSEKPEKTLEEELIEFREARRDFGYEIAKSLGLLRLIAHFGLRFKPWVRERQIRDEWKRK